MNDQFRECRVYRDWSLKNKHEYKALCHINIVGFLLNSKSEKIRSLR
jgi:hypothetical protein